jgi:methionine sulfoxide reductase heme-binding subunit
MLRSAQDDKWMARVVRVAAHAGALIPLARLLWDGYYRHLTVNPFQAVAQRTGTAALILLVLALACTPLNATLGLRWAIPPRRTLGLYAFAYACLHVLMFTVDYLVLVDYPSRWDLVKQQVIEKRYIIAGFGAFVLLIPLAITSTKGWQRRLGRRWRLLHRAVYVAAPLAVIHFLWNAKGGGDRNEPLVYGAIVAALLVLRLPWVRRAAYRWRTRAVGPRKRTLVLE